MKVGSQLHALVTLPWGKGPRASVDMVVKSRVSAPSNKQDPSRPAHTAQATPFPIY
jgi:hypothetical protein